jgi:hypothetical protein
MPDGEPVRRAWLTHKGMQILLIDDSTGVAVRIDGLLTMDRRVPFHPRSSATAYFTGEGQEPLGMPIRVYKPCKTLPEERAHANGVIAACKAWAKLMDYPDLLTGHINRWERKPVKYEVVCDNEFAKLDVPTRLRISVYGYILCRIPSEVRWSDPYTNGEPRCILSTQNNLSR